MPSSNDGDNKSKKGAKQSGGIEVTPECNTITDKDQFEKLLKEGNADAKILGTLYKKFIADGELSSIEKSLLEKADKILKNAHFVGFLDSDMALVTEETNGHTDKAYLLLSKESVKRNEEFRKNNPKNKPRSF